MDGFKKIIKMKAGGSVAKAVAAYEKKEERAESKMHEDEKQDKKLIKKAFSMHDDQKHEGKTNLSGLKKGGRTKKDAGTVRKYKCGGNVKKMADGSLTGPLAAANQAVGVPATTAQNVAAADLVKRKLLAQQAAKTRGVVPPAAGAAGAAPAGGMAAAPAAPVGQPTPQNIGATTGPIMKKGGKVKKMADGKSTGFTPASPSQKFSGTSSALKDLAGKAKHSDNVMSNLPWTSQDQKRLDSLPDRGLSKLPWTSEDQKRMDSLPNRGLELLKKGGKVKKGCK